MAAGTSWKSKVKIGNGKNHQKSQTRGRGPRIYAQEIQKAVGRKRRKDVTSVERVRKKNSGKRKKNETALTWEQAPKR